MRGFLREIAGDHAAASSLQLEALEIARELEDEPLLLHCLSHASGALHNQGSRLGAGTAAGREALARAEALARELCGIVPERSRRLPLARLLLAAAVFYQGRMSEAAALLRDTADHALRLGTRTELMYAAAFASEIALRNGETEQAALLYGAFDEIRDRLGFSDERLSSFNNGWHDDFLNRLQEARDPDTLAALLERGKTTPIDQLLRSVA
jgi:ATP/maltotriose-dependent transcriptional regulator MalT